MSEPLSLERVEELERLKQVAVMKWSGPGAEDAWDTYYKALNEAFPSILTLARTALEPPPAVGVGEAKRTRERLDWPTGEFEVNDPEPDNHHSPLYLQFPGGFLANLSHDNREGLDIARTTWIVETLNAALRAGGQP